jgi:hypothetical protein
MRALDSCPGDDAMLTMRQSVSEPIMAGRNSRARNIGARELIAIVCSISRTVEVSQK